VTGRASSLQEDCFIDDVLSFEGPGQRGVTTERGPEKSVIVI